MQLVTLDFETHYDKDYTLKKLTTEEYVRDSRFKVHCVGYKYANTETKIVNLEEFNKAKQPVGVLCHHTHFDGLILSHHYGIKPAFWFDTLSMARLVLPHLKSHSLGALAEHYGLHQKTVPYNLFIGKRDLDSQTQTALEDGCKHDVELTYQIFLRLLPHVSQEELRVIDLTIRLSTEPVLRVDRPRLKNFLEGENKRKQEILERCCVQK
jgi:hypothetical protein